MNIGQLFVSLGIKDSGKTVETITKTRQGLKDSASQAWQTRVALLGAMYATQRFLAASSKTGTGLQNFSAQLGISTKTLQQYQYAARQVGVSNEAVEQSFRSIQDTVTKTKLGEGAPKGLARVSNLTGLTFEQFSNSANNPAILMQKLQEYAQKEKDAGLRNATLKSFGIGDDMAAALKRNAFKPSVLAQAPTYSDAQIKQLDKANAAWMNLSNTIEMAIGEFNSKHGVMIVQNVTNLVDAVLKLSSGLTTLAEKLQVLEGITMITDWTAEQVGAWTQFLESENKTEFLKNSIQKDVDDAGEMIYNLKNMFKVFMDDVGPKKVGAPKSFTDSFGIKKIEPNVRPAPPSRSAISNNQNNNTNINQTLNFNGDGKDAGKVSDGWKKSIQDAARVMGPAVSQGS